MTTSIDATLRSAAEAAPARPALRWRDVRLRYRELDRAVERAAEGLRRAGAARGERVAVVAPNVPGAVVALFAAWRVGAVAVPLSDRLRAHDLGAALETVDPSVAVVVGRSEAAPVDVVGLAAAHVSTGAVLVADAGGRLEVHEQARVGRVRAGTGPLPDDIALVLTTSGSTGTPKAALVTHRREVESPRDLAGLLALGEDDATVLVVSIAHAFGLSCLLAAFASRGEVVLVDSTTSSGPLRDALAGATVLHGSPTLFASLARGAGALPASLRAGFVAGARAPAGLLEALDRAGLPLVNLYGMTEVGAASATRPRDPSDVRWRTAGRSLPGHELRIHDGEVEVRGAHVTPGYFRQDERTAAAFRDGWLRTGDLGSIDAAGNLVITGRLDDLASVGGFNVSPAEVEVCLLDHPGTVAAAVVAVPDERLGDALVAFVVPRPGATIEPRDLLGHVRQRLAGYKVPYRVEFMDALPRLPTGKPDRHALRRLAAEPRP